MDVLCILPCALVAGFAELIGEGAAATAFELALVGMGHAILGAAISEFNFLAMRAEQDIDADA